MSPMRRWLKKWDLNTKCFRIDHLTDPLYKKPSYLRDLLTKIYNKKDMSDQIKYLLNQKIEVLKSLNLN